MFKRIVFVALLAASGGAMAKDLSNIPLVWSPTQSFAEFGAVDLNGINNVKVQFNAFTDVRKNPPLIAENHEKEPVRQVTTKDNVAAFVTDHVKETFGIDAAGARSLGSERDQTFLLTGPAGGRLDAVSAFAGEAAD